MYYYLEDLARRGEVEPMAKDRELVILPPTPEKTLDPDDPDHPRRAREAELSMRDAYMNQVVEYYDRVQEWISENDEVVVMSCDLAQDRVGSLHNLGIGLDIRERIWDQAHVLEWYRELSEYPGFPKRSDSGILVIGPPANGKTTICDDLAGKIPRSFSLEKGGEPWLTGMHRDACVSSSIPRKYVYPETEDDFLVRLDLYVWSKMKERFRMNIIHSILARNGCIPIANGGLVQVDISGRAYGAYRLDDNGPTLPLEMAPWQPKMCIMADLSGGGDIDKAVGEAIIRAAAQGERRAREGGSSVSKAMIAGRDSYGDRLAPVRVYERLATVLQGFLRSGYYNCVAINTQNRRTMSGGLDKIEIPVNPAPLDLCRIIAEMRVLLPEVEPGAVISHIRREDVAGAVQSCNETRAMLMHEIAMMEEKMNVLEQQGEHNRIFIDYLAERKSVLKAIFKC